MQEALKKYRWPRDKYIEEAKKTTIEAVSDVAVPAN